MISSRSALLVCAAGIVTVVFAIAGAGSAYQPTAAPPAPPAARLPSDVAFEESGDEVKDRHQFNDFSWRVFIALNWPAVGTARGEPDVNKPFGAPAERVVWGSWKSLDELYPPDPVTNPPTGWASFDAELPELRPKKGVTKDAARKLFLGSPIPLGTVTTAGFSAKARLAPLVAQNKKYVRYEVRVNKIAYEFIQTNKYYLRDILTQAVAEKGSLPFPTGSVVVKAAWMELDGVEKAERFFQMRAEIDDSPGPTFDAKLRPAVVGLVGLHIAYLTPLKRSWIWSTFEHVDNTEPGPGGHPASFSKNDPEIIHSDHDVDKVPEVPVVDKPLDPDPKPVDVERALAVHPTTHNVNLRHHKSAVVKGTVWQNYRLIATQWVAAPNPKDPDPGDPTKIREFRDTNPPRLLPAGAVANTTIETYSQAEACLGCHRQAKTDCRFVFFPTARAYDPPKRP